MKIEFTINTTTYESNAKGTYFYATDKSDAGLWIKRRISKAEFEAAHEQFTAEQAELIETIKAYWMATMAITETREQMDEAWATEEGMQDLMGWYEDEKEAGLTEEDMLKEIEATKLDAAAENDEISLEQFVELVQEAEESATTEQIEEIQKEMVPKAKKERKPRKSKDIAFEYRYNTIDDPEGEMVTLTAKQVDFIHHLPDSNFWERGLDSSLWTDVLCDEIGGQFAGKPMTVGAMISTLCEKGLAERGKMKVNGKKCTYFELSPKGKAVAKALGLK